MSAPNLLLDDNPASAIVNPVQAMSAIDYLQTKSLFVHNTDETAWSMHLVFDKNGIDRHLSTMRNEQEYHDSYCWNCYNSK